MSISMKVTIDGPAASGKSTIARMVADALNFLSLDSGAIYRAQALHCKNNGIDPDDSIAVQNCLKGFEYQFKGENKNQRHFINDIEVTQDIRTSAISQYSSKIATYPNVRAQSSKIQRKIAEGKHVVVDARDSGTIVFAEAQLKIFLSASKEERAKRRLADLLTKYPEKRESIDLSTVFRDLEERDERDTQRECAPLRCAVDAVGIDTTGKSIKQVVKEIVNLVKKRKIRRYSKFWAWLIGKELARVSLPYKIVYSFTYMVYRLFYRFEVRGLENYPKGSAIITPNHMSFLDPPLLGIACPQEVYALGIAYLWKIPGCSWLLPRINTLPVTGSAKDFTSIKAVSALLLRGQQVIIFPEGTRSFDGEILPLKRGIALLASIGNSAIVPTIIMGSQKAWPRNNWLPKPWGKLIVAFGKPLHWENYKTKFESKREGQLALLVDLSKAMKALQKEQREATGLF